MAGTGAFPLSEIMGWDKRKLLYVSSALHPSGTNGRFLISTMMDHCAPQLHEGLAGHIQHNIGLRLWDIWQIHRRGVPLIQNALVVLDIALPRDVDPVVRERSGVTYVDLDTLRTAGAMVSDDEVRAAAAIVADELAAFNSLLRERGVPNVLVGGEPPETSQ